MTGAQVALGWVATRFITLVLLVTYEGSRGVVGDVNYFAKSLSTLSENGVAHTLLEYPVPAVGLVAVPWLLTLGSNSLYPVVVIAGALLVDAAFTAFLTTRPGPGSRDGVLLWLVAAPLLGGLMLMRFDLVAGVLVAVALLVIGPRPRLASTAVGIATAIKLWPVILLPSFVAAARRRRDVVVPFVVLGVVVALASLLLAGWDRLVSPLAYQADRGLQVESLAAAPAMVGWLADPVRWDVGYSRFKAFEVTGPGVPALLMTTTLLSVALLGLLLMLWWRAFRRHAPVTPEALLWLCLASVTGFLASAKVFSPQYLLWLLPLAAAGLTLVPSAPVRRWSVGLLIVTAMSHVIYPVVYQGLVEHGGLSAVAVPLLVVRDVSVVVLLVLAAREAWRATSTSCDLAAEPRSRMPDAG